MFRYILTSFRGYRLSYLKNDLISGVIVAALTIPVAMGYAQVAGLPPIYGLYASMLPVLGYVLFASSPQLIFGADAAASATTGSCLATLGIVAGSQDAAPAAAMLSLFTGIFLIMFAVLKLGRFAAYISKPVISGFLSGTAVSIIVGQVPKIIGVKGQGNDFFGNLKAIGTHLGDINLISVVLGIVTVIIILLGKKYLPKLPVALLVMIVGTIVTAVCHLDHYGVSVVGEIPKGLPHLSLPDLLHAKNLMGYIGASLMIAVVIFADSLMSSESFAEKNGYQIDGNREIFAFGISNLIACISGCAPTSASVSRTAASEQFHGKTQMVSVVAAVIVGLVVLFFSPALYYMPQPLLGGIVLAALVGVVDIKELRRLLRCGRSEARIWLFSAVGVLLVGTLFGVIVGVILSFVDVIVRITTPPQAYLGVIQGKDGYFDLSAHKNAKAVSDTVIYRFSARLFFANISIFKAGVEKAIADSHPRTMIFDAAGINSIDATAADELKVLLQELSEQGIQYYFAGQTETLNKQFVAVGLWPKEDCTHIKKTIEDALGAA